MLKTQYPLASEPIEPAVQYIIGRMFMQADTAPPESKENACFYLWMAVSCIDRLAAAANMAEGPNGERPVHFRIAAGNIRREISNYIESVLGFNPWFDKEHPTAKRWAQSI